MKVIFLLTLAIKVEYKNSILYRNNSAEYKVRRLKLLSGNAMNKIRFWIPFFIGVLITPVFFYASTLSGSSAASHAGAGFQMILFYPIPFFLAIFSSPVLGIGLAIIQFPLFGFIVSYANSKKGSVFYAVIKVVIWLHITVSLISLLFVLITVR